MSAPSSASKLFIGDPTKVMVIRDLTPTLTTFSMPFLRFGYLKVGGRATLVKLQTGSLAVFSPVALTPDVKSKVSSMGGQVRYIIAPDTEHHLQVTPWSKEFPEAMVIGPEGLPEKREGTPETKGIKFAHVFTESNRRDLRISSEFDQEFEYEYLPKYGNKELVFLHKPTRTLIEADVMFNLPATEQFSKSGIDPNTGILSRLFGALQHTRGEMLGQRRLMWYALAVQDRKMFGESAKRMCAWDFDRIIPCHGDVIETGGKAVLEKATKWFRDLV